MAATPHELGSGYSADAVAWAVVGTLLVPPLTLLLAFVALGNQTDPAKRSQLRAWAWMSAGWLVIAFAAAVLLAEF